MKVEKMNGKKRIWLLLFALVWCAQMFTAFYFCYQKQGFHEDEYYSYYSTSRTNGFWVEDQKWMEHDEYFNEYVVLEGQKFQYGLVKQVQSWDVHPPVYYWVLHTVCSLFPGQFSKWFGLSINLAAFGISLWLLRYLTLQVTKGSDKMAFLVGSFYGFTPAVMSSVVFIRMYMLLTVFVLLCAILHMKAIEDYTDTNNRLSVKKFLFPLAVVTYLGFLTQYYYAIFLFFMAAGFCIYLLWKERNLRNCIRYGISLLIAFGLAYVTYPSCLGQMFRGQRGAQATENFFDLSNTVERLQFFWNLLDEYVFGKMLSVLLLLMVVLAVTTRCKQKEAFDTRGWLLLFAVIGYFLVVSKTGLLLGNTSVRYQTPIYGMVVLLVFEVIRRLGRMCGIWEQREHGGRDVWILTAAVVIGLVVNGNGLLSDRVVFLYPEDKEQVAFAKECAEQEVPVLYLYDEGQSWCIWDCTNELFEYDRVFFAGQSSTDKIRDNEITDSESLVVYLSNSADAKEQLQRILNSNTHVTKYELQYQESYCDVYYFD